MSVLSSLYNLAVLGRLRDDSGPFDPSRVNKILVVRNDNIGDVICTTPALDALRAAFPHAYIAALVCTLTERAISGHRALDRLYVYPKAKHRQFGRLESLKRLAVIQAEIKKEKFDLALAFRASFSSSQGWLTYASGARWRVGPRALGKRKKWEFYYNIPTDPPPDGLHEVERCYHYLESLGLTVGDHGLYLEVPLNARSAAGDFLGAHGLVGRPGLVMVNITRWAYRPDRLWPAERYRTLLERLISEGKPVIVTHAPADAKWVGELLKGLEPMPPVFWSGDLKEFLALVAEAGVFVTAEGGPMHMAAAVGTPQVILWGRTPRDVWSPWKAPHVILGRGGPVDEISVDQVMEALGNPPARQ